MCVKLCPSSVCLASGDTSCGPPSVGREFLARLASRWLDFTPLESVTQLPVESSQRIALTRYQVMHRPNEGGCGRLICDGLILCLPGLIIWLPSGSAREM